MNFPINVGCSVEPDNVISPGTKPDVHIFKRATHLRPLDAVQSVVPQAQSMEFASLPSIFVHDESCALTTVDIDERFRQKSSAIVANICTGMWCSVFVYFSKGEMLDFDRVGNDF